MVVIGDEWNDKSEEEILEYIRSEKKKEEVSKKIVEAKANVARTFYQFDTVYTQHFLNNENRNEPSVKFYNPNYGSKNMLSLLYLLEETIRNVRESIFAYVDIEKECLEETMPNKK